AASLVLGFAPAPAAAQPRTPDAAAQVPDMPPVAPISAAEYANRRSAIVNTLGDGVFLALGAPPPAADYLPFSQDQVFRYLTGITEPAAALVVSKKGDQIDEWLFVLPRDPSREVWEGDRLGTERAAALTGIRAEPNDRLMPVLDSLLAVHTLLYSPTEPWLGAEADVNVPYDHQ